MKILNIHHRVINQPISTLGPLLDTLSTREDRLFPFEKWPAMKFKEGLRIGAQGGHGPIRYVVKRIEPQRLVEFSFTQPQGFQGSHWFEVRAVDEQHTELKHTIAMQTGLWGSVQWLLGIRALHDALIEDAFDKVENQFGDAKKLSKWRLWVRVLRKLLD